jgi:ABC-2 type transport system permease protein
MTPAAHPMRPPGAAFGQLLACEARIAWRVPVGLLLGVAAPIVVLVVLGSIPGTNVPVNRLGGRTYFSVYFPVVISLVIAALSLISLPMHLANYREQGVLRRISTTPVPPSWMLAAQVVVNLGLAAVALGAVIVAGTVAFGLDAPRAPGGFVLALVLTVSAMFAIGLWISAVARTTGAAGAMGQLLLYPLLFAAGLWIPREIMSPVLRRIGDFTPLGASVQSLQDAMQGTFPSAEALAVLIGWTVVLGALALRFFRWE